MFRKKVTRWVGVSMCDDFAYFYSNMLQANSSSSSDVGLDENQTAGEAISEELPCGEDSEIDFVESVIHHNDVISIHPIVDYQKHRINWPIISIESTPNERIAELNEEIFQLEDQRDEVLSQCERQHTKKINAAVNKLLKIQKEGEKDFSNYLYDVFELNLIVGKQHIKDRLAERIHQRQTESIYDADPIGNAFHIIFLRIKAAQTFDQIEARLDELRKEFAEQGGIDLLAIRKKLATVIREGKSAMKHELDDIDESFEKRRFEIEQKIRIIQQGENRAES
ncbi:MAG: hypothetical protein HQK53_05320 [Oligoflexia bacterium]|nr:hypothetical protein [Oligoflexia bacterium]